MKIEKIIDLHFNLSFSNLGDKPERKNEQASFSVDQTDGVKMEDVIRELLTQADQVSEKQILKILERK